MEATVDDVFEILRHTEAYPSFCQDIEKVFLLSRPDEEERICEWACHLDGTPFVWTQRESFSQLDRRARFELIDGDLDEYIVVLEVEAGTATPSCAISAEVSADFGLWELLQLIGPTLWRTMREQTQRLLTDVKKHAESQAGLASYTSGGSAGL